MRYGILTIPALQRYADAGGLDGGVNIIEYVLWYGDESRQDVTERAEALAGQTSRNVHVYSQRENAPFASPVTSFMWGPTTGVTRYDH